MARSKGQSGGSARSLYRSLKHPLSVPFADALSYLSRPLADEISMLEQIDYTGVTSDQDRRRYHPDRPGPGRITAEDLYYPSRYLFRFARPSRNVVCAHRRIRRSVLFALGRTGRGRRSKRRNYSEYSRVRC